MFLRRVFLLCLFVVISFSVRAQKKDDFKQPRILILLDASSSMVNEWMDGKTRFSGAGEIVLRLMDSIYKVNDGVEFALRAYGHEHGVPENNCFDTRREVMFSKNNYTQMSLRLANIHPLGVSPIAYSLQTAAETDFTNSNDYAYSLVLITDGGESCGGDICDVVRNLLEKKIEFKPYILSLVDYAPLQDQYNCLGNYLTVTKPSEIAPAIHTITEAYRKLLAIPVPRQKLLTTMNIPPPSVQKIKVPSVQITQTEPETTFVKKPEIIPQPVTKPVAVKRDTVPVLVKKDSMAAPVKQARPDTPVRRASSSRIKVETSFFKKEKIAPLEKLNFDRIQYSLFWSTTSPAKRHVPVFSIPPPEPEAAAQPKPVIHRPVEPVIYKAVAPVPRKEEAKEAAVTTSTEPAKETLLEIYFTDGKGKFYQTTPPVQVLDASTGAQVKRFYRTVNAQGAPDPQQISAGKYILVIGKSGHFKTKAISVAAGNKNRVDVVVTNGTLIFRYESNLKRPVKEFNASVRKTFVANTNVFQKCSEERAYEPGNYHIEVNTLPVSRYNIEIEFGWSYYINIDEPGFVQFTNAQPLGRVSLYYQLGDQFLKFYNMEIPGNYEAQKLRLKPGVYEVHWKKNPKLPLEPETTRRFYVKSNEITEFEIE